MAGWDRTPLPIDGDGRTWVASGEFLGWYRDGSCSGFPRDRQRDRIAPARSGGIWISTAGGC